MAESTEHAQVASREPPAPTAPIPLSAAMSFNVLVLVWSLPGLLHALQRLVFDGAHISPVRIFIFCIPLWWPWIPATRLALWLADRLPVSEDVEPAMDDGSRPWVQPGPKTWVVHIVSALALSALHMVLLLLWTKVISPFGPIPLSMNTFLRSLAEPVFMVSLSSYLLILCAHYVASLANRLHERNLQEARLLGRLSEAEIRSLRMQLRPEALAENLNKISDQVRSGEYDAAESAIGQLARNLRETLRHGDNLPEVWSNPDLERRSRNRARP